MRLAVQVRQVSDGLLHQLLPSRKLLCVSFEGVPARGAKNRVWKLIACAPTTRGRRAGAAAPIRFINPVLGVHLTYPVCDVYPTDPILLVSLTVRILDVHVTV